VSLSSEDSQGQVNPDHTRQWDKVTF